MVFHIMNYMRETNVWMIRKCRWLLWGFVCTVPIYRNTYWDFHGRRVAWKSWFDFRTEKQKCEEAKNEKGNWGYKPRYNPVYDFSIKQRKYNTQTRLEKVNDTPRIKTTTQRYEQKGCVDPKKVRTLTYILKEHNRVPGAFDYNYNQDFYSLMPELDYEAYYVIGSKQRKNVDTLFQYSSGIEQ